MALRFWEQSSQVYLFVIVLVAAVVVVYFVFLNPLQTQINQVYQQNVDLQVRIDQLQAVERKLPEYDREIQEQKARLEGLKSALPDEKETAEIIRQVQRYAISSNIRVRTFRPHQTIGQEFYTEWPIRMEFDGSYHNLGAFFERVSRHPRVINVTNLRIQRIPDSTDLSRTISASCTATTFVYKESN